MSYDRGYDAGIDAGWEMAFRCVEKWLKEKNAEVQGYENKSGLGALLSEELSFVYEKIDKGWS